MATRPATRRAPEPGLGRAVAAEAMDLAGLARRVAPTRRTAGIVGVALLALVALSGVAGAAEPKTDARTALEAWGASPAPVASGVTAATPGAQGGTPPADAAAPVMPVASARADAAGSTTSTSSGAGSSAGSSSAASGSAGSSSAASGSAGASGSSSPAGDDGLPAGALGASPLFAGPDWLDLGLKVVLVVVLLVITLRVLRRVQGAGSGKGSGALLEIVESRPIGPKSQLHLVAVGDRRLVVGQTPAGLVALGELDAAELPAGNDIIDSLVLAVADEPASPRATDRPAERVEAARPRLADRSPERTGPARPRGRDAVRPERTDEATPGGRDATLPRPGAPRRPLDARPLPTPVAGSAAELAEAARRARAGAEAVAGDGAAGRRAPDGLPATPRRVDARVAAYVAAGGDADEAATLDALRGPDPRLDRPARTAPPAPSGRPSVDERVERATARARAERAVAVARAERMARLDRALAAADRAAEIAERATAAAERAAAAADRAAGSDAVRGSAIDAAIARAGAAGDERRQAAAVGRVDRAAGVTGRAADAERPGRAASPARPEDPTPRPGFDPRRAALLASRRAPAREPGDAEAPGAVAPDAGLLDLARRLADEVTRGRGRTPIAALDDEPTLPDRPAVVRSRVIPPAEAESILRGARPATREAAAGATGRPAPAASVGSDARRNAIEAIMAALRAEEAEAAADAARDGRDPRDARPARDEGDDTPAPFMPAAPSAPAVAVTPDDDDRPARPRLPRRLEVSA